VGTPAALLDHLGQMDVFARRDDGHLIEMWQNGPGGAIDQGNDLGGDFDGDPVVVTKPDGVKVVFIRGHDGQLWQKWQTAVDGEFTDSRPVRGDLGVITGKPSVLIDATGRQTVYVVRPDHHLVTAWQSVAGGEFDGLKDLGGDFEGDPVAVQKASGVQVVFVRGKDGQLWHKWQDAPGGNFGPSALVRDDFGPMTGAPAVVLGAGDVVQVFARRSTDGHLITAWQPSAAGGFTGIDDIGGALNSDPVIRMLPSGVQAAFGRFSDGSVMTTGQNAPGAPFSKSWTFLNTQ
jgi:hypothetical protein